MFRYYRQIRALVCFIAVMGLMLGIGVIATSYWQYELLMNQTKERMRRDLNLVGTFTQEALLRKDYGAVEEFILNWGGQYPEIINLNASTPDGFVIASFERDIPDSYSFLLMHTISYEGKPLLNITMSEDFMPLKEQLHNLTIKYIIVSFVFMLVLGILLWIVFKKAAIIPLEKEIDEHQRAKMKIKDSEIKYRTLFESPNYTLMLADENGFIDCNNATLKLFGYTSREKFINKHPSEVSPPFQPCGRDSLSLANEQIVKAYTDGSNHFEWVYRRKNGELFPAEVFLTAMGIKGKNIVQAAVYDITERRKTEEALARRTEELARSNEELQQFASIASHDLQEPLRMVTSYVQLLEKKYKGKLDEDAEEFIYYAVDGAKRMQKLVNDLLTYSRVQTRAKPFAETDVGAVLKNTLMNLQKAIEDNKAEVTNDPLPEIMADEGQLTQLFQNLIANAMKFHGKEQPKVHISARQEQDNWVFSVKDNGIGIEEKHKERIFQIFQRLHSRSEYEGTGIGLAVCRKIVERHGGKIWVESETGQGTMFYFTIPIQKMTSDD